MKYPDFDGEQACIGIDTNLFYPEERNTKRITGKKLLNLNMIRATCNSCKFLNECREYGIHHENFGIWGGLTEIERFRIRKQRGIVLDRPDKGFSKMLK